MDLEQSVRKLLFELSHGYDAVLRRIELRFPQSEKLATVSLTLSVKGPIPQKRNGDWVNVRLRIKDVEELALRESAKETCRVLSSGIQTTVCKDVVFFDFAPYSVSPQGLEDFRRSGCYVAGRSFTWEVTDFSDLEQSRNPEPESKIS